LDSGRGGDSASSTIFGPRTGWENPDVISIDVGITLLTAEKLRFEFV
jgi:hypothetical protein